ncbi:Ceramide_synthetase [Hexamita inflata]|uniref:Ceramide synthetase n=1 Tax=Hexamita inflata TaxID=28002 RepID=A0AA86U5W9_9EUKA|nr:Ceramide synthetase [Hexamita inflata]
MFTGNFNWGCSTANLHDLSDIFLEFSKIIYYLGFENGSKVTFVVFAVSFIIPRCVVFPVFMIAPFLNGKVNQVLKQIDSQVNMEVFGKVERVVITSGLCVLFFLDCIWACAITYMGVGMIKKKKWVDVRETKHSD